jgi:hypothetical protein
MDRSAERKRNSGDVLSSSARVFHQWMEAMAMAHAMPFIN